MLEGWLALNPGRISATEKKLHETSSSLYLGCSFSFGPGRGLRRGSERRKADSRDGKHPRAAARYFEMRWHFAGSARPVKPGHQQGECAQIEQRCGLLRPDKRPQLLFGRTQ